MPKTRSRETPERLSGPRAGASLRRSSGRSRPRIKSGATKQGAERPGAHAIRGHWRCVNPVGLRGRDSASGCYTNGTGMGLMH